MTIREIVSESIEKYSELKSFSFPTKDGVANKTYRALGEDLRRMRGSLERDGFARAHIAIAGKNSYPWVVTYLSVITGEGVAVPLDASLPDDNLIWQLNQADVTCAFIESSKKDLIARAKAECPELAKVIVLGNDVLPGADATWGSYMEKGTDELEAGNGENDADAASAGNAENGACATSKGTYDSPINVDVEKPEDAVCTIMFSSGTTGVSKAIMLTQGNLGAEVKNRFYHTEPGTVLFSVLPIHHAFCLSVDVLTAIKLGVNTCINDSVGHLMKNLKTFEPQVILMVPLMVETIYKKLKTVNRLIPKKLVGREVFGRRLNHIIVGGAYLDPMYVTEFRKYGITIWQGYGMTETSPVIAFNGERGIADGSVGRPIDNTEVKIEDGEILVRGDIVMKGYYKMPEETAEALKDGWMHTGDLGRFDENGFLYITGRKKNLIILANGENVSPEELENDLYKIPLIGEVVVMGQPQGLIAHVYPDETETKKMSPDVIREKIRKEVDKYNKKQPAYRRIIDVVMRDEPFPKTTTRKIKRDCI